MAKPFLTVEVFVEKQQHFFNTNSLLNRVSLDWDTFQSEHVDWEFPATVPLTVPGGDEVGYFTVS